MSFKTSQKAISLPFLILILFLSSGCEQSVASQWQKALDLESKGKTEKAIIVWKNAAKSNLDENWGHTLICD